LKFNYNTPGTVSLASAGPYEKMKLSQTYWRFYIIFFLFCKNQTLLLERKVFGLKSWWF